MSGDEDVCGVCIEGGEGLVALPGCGHRFHVSCVMNFSQYDLRCPVCRQTPSGLLPRRGTGGGGDGSSLVSPIDLDAEEDDNLAGAVRAMHAQLARLAARRRRAIRRDPRLHAANERLLSAQREFTARSRDLQREYDRRCRDVWRSDADIVGQKRALALLRRRELRLRRTINASLEELEIPSLSPLVGRQLFAVRLVHRAGEEEEDGGDGAPPSSLPPSGEGGRA
jgi:hypothetical protein